MRQIIIAVDFDGTCVEHSYPKVGADLPHAERVLKRIAESGHQIILWTMRSGSTLQDAVAWFERRSIPLWGVNNNPQQAKWTASPKVYAHMYIDDAALGCPLLLHQNYHNVDWEAVEMMLEGYAILDSTDVPTH